MWFIYALVHVFLLALVNYIDEYLTNNNKLPENTNIHTKIGGLLLVSTLMSFLGATTIGLITQNIDLPTNSLVLALLSAIPMVAMYASYFYLLTIYPTHLVVPLFQISSFWLLFLEILFGGTITTSGLIGMLILMYGAYLLDAGTFKWQIPTKLLLIAIPVTSTWALSLFLVRAASETGSPVAISFYQLIGIGSIGILLFTFIKKYRDGFLFRIRNQGRNFLGFSLVNESLAQGGYLFSNLAVAIAPVAAFVTAMSGVQSVFLLFLFLLFPQGERTKATKLQWFAVALITLGVFLIESR